jgi:hypothetical protein
MHTRWFNTNIKLESALKIFNNLYPNCVGVFFFDQSSAHNAFGEDALVAKRMNVGPGGKTAKPMHTTIIPMDNPNPLLRGKSQYMVFPEVNERAGQSKGMKLVLEERGLLATLDLNRNGQPVGVCNECKKSEAARTKAEKDARERMAEDPEFFGSLGEVIN